MPCVVTKSQEFARQSNSVAHDDAGKGRRYKILTRRDNWQLRINLLAGSTASPYFRGFGPATLAGFDVCHVTLIERARAAIRSREGSAASKADTSGLADS